MTEPRSEKSGRSREAITYLGFVAVLMVQTGYMGTLRAGAVAVALAAFALVLLLKDAVESYRGQR